MFIFGQKNELEAEISFWELFLMAFSGTFGAGLFILIGAGTQIAGYALPFAFLLAGIISFFVNHIYAELSVSLPKAGGGQVYLRNAFGEKPLLFVIHWLTWLAEIAFTAVNALGLGVYLAGLIGINPLLLTFLAISLLIIINLLGVKHIGKIELIIGLILIVALSGIISVNFQYFSPKNVDFERIFSSFLKLQWLQAVPLIFLVFIGTEDIAAIAAEVKNKQKNLPKALFLTGIAITILTTIFSFLFLHSFDLQKIINSQQPLYLLLEKSNPFFRTLIITTPILATASSMFFGFLADTRTAYALAKADELPSIFTKLNRFKTPYISIVFCGFVSLLLCFTRSASFISQIATIGFLLECIAISFAFLKLRKERPHLPRPYLIKYSTIIPFLVIIASTLLLLFVDFRSWLIALTFAILGLILHFLSYIEKERLKIAFWGMKILFLVGSVIVLGLIYILI